MRPTLLIAFAALAIASSAHTQTAPVAVSVMPGDVKYMPIPFAPGAEAMWLAGAPDAAGIYTVRVRAAKDAKLPPHTHTDTRMVTVLSGELYAGNGEKFDTENGKLYPAGAFFTVPAGVAHFVWARNGEVTYQESGFGPSPTALIKQ